MTSRPSGVDGSSNRPGLDESSSDGSPVHPSSGDDRSVEGGSLGKLAWLGSLYVVQGLPFGFQASALPMYLRTADRSLTEIGLASFLALPWMLKVLWSPWVDRYGSERLGRRKSWILPLQLLLALSCGALALTTPDEQLMELLVLVALTNLFAATMDIAVDGLAVDLLQEHELGLGNAVQVVGFKLGMLAGGGLLVWASVWIGWRGLFLTMGGVVVLAMVLTATMREPPRRSVKPPSSMSALGTLFLEQLRTPGALGVLALVATYKMGETLADAMLRPFLIDAGFEASQLGLWLGTYGMVASIAGSIVGGVLASRSIRGALMATAIARAIPVALEWWLTTHAPTAAEVIAVTSAESFFGGALTTVMFAYMMSRVDPRIGATHFTLLASVEVFGKLPLAPVAGALADARGYGLVFAIAAAICAAWPGLLFVLTRRDGSRSGPSVF